MDSVYLSMSKFTCSDVFLLRELGSGFSQNKKIIPNQFQYMIPKSRMEGVIFTKESVNFMKGKEFFKKNKMELKMENSILADYYKTTDRRYDVRCQVRSDGHNIIDLTLSVKTREQAEAICNNWKNQNDDVYAYLMDILLK